MGWCAQEVDVSKLNAKCLMQRKWVPIKDDVTYFDNKNEAEFTFSNVLEIIKFTYSFVQIKTLEHAFICQ